LSGAGYELIEALTGPDAVAIATREVPDLVLMDIQLPGIDGYEATRRRWQPEPHCYPAQLSQRPQAKRCDNGSELTLTTD
jgi:CheY-like chemotaxis protein